MARKIDCNKIWICWKTEGSENDLEIKS
jgi:hypothetical protein